MKAGILEHSVNEKVDALSCMCGSPRPTGQLCHQSPLSVSAQYLETVSPRALPHVGCILYAEATSLGLAT